MRNLVISMTTSLQFYWYEIRPSEELGKRRGQLAGAMHRLGFVCGELASVLDATDINEMLDRLQYHAENYLIRAYELRERAVFLVAGLCGDKSLAKFLKDPRRRVEALAQVSAKSPSFVEPLDRLLMALDHDVELRNFHTHNTFLSLGLWTGDDIYDPQDALLDLENRPDEREELESFLRDEAKLLVTEYAEKGRKLIEATMCLLKVADLRRSV